MGSALTNALLITAIGMGLVFLAILALWGLMELMMRLGAERKTAAAVEDDAAIEAAEEAPALSDPRKARAAALAVSVALALRQRSAAPAAPASGLSAWQAVLRAGQLTQQMQSYNRRSRGNQR